MTITQVASSIILNLIAASIISFFIGYLLAKMLSSKNTVNRKSKSKTVKSHAAVNPVFKKTSNLDNKPLVLSSAKISGKDNLKKIKGVDSKIEKDLNNLGIYHFEQIAKWSSKNCDWIETFLLLPGCAKQNQWVEQAKILQTGKDTIYSQKVENGEIIVD